MSRHHFDALMTFVMDRAGINPGLLIPESNTQTTGPYKYLNDSVAYAWLMPLR